jgi:hypothetical protein
VAVFGAVPDAPAAYVVALELGNEYTGMEGLVPLQL